MKKVIAASLLLCLALVGCVRSPLVGRWSFDGTDRVGVLTFKSNGHWEKTMKTGKGEIIESGTFKIEGDTITVTAGKARYEGQPDSFAEQFVKMGNAEISEIPKKARFRISENHGEQLDLSGSQLTGIYRRVK